MEIHVLGKVSRMVVTHVPTEEISEGIIPSENLPENNPGTL